MLGQKLPLMVIGKSEKPRNYKEILKLNLYYYLNKSAWMTGKIFFDLLENLKKKMANDNDRKILLFVDNLGLVAYVIEDLGREFVSLVFYRLRQMCSLGLDKGSLLLGGSGKIVEIDESLYARVKFNKCKDLKRAQVWVFGLVERIENNSKCYMVLVPDREALTLLGIIYEKCREGTIIYSDCWSSYSNLSQLKNFHNKTVNHSFNFVDPESGFIFF
ncbi:unnamed protein product [Brachionus calyciflorus]|uniref:ISXO2-like transposase domain-containing protein n=1 Tax=Brachionus calyciflorus TaxID=104777 RepID=A0A813S7H7_9BILA|nr:unnamed protein product [Brachionus calyciflorus]